MPAILEPLLKSEQHRADLKVELRARPPNDALVRMVRRAMRPNIVGTSLSALSLLVVLTSAASGQTGGSGIAGVVRDASGAVLPGVTVEAASPALIEKTRTAVTDDQGLYKIVDLRPGTYSMTFTLPGFRTVKREGIELSANFTAPVNADLAIGSLEETITVSGDTPVVDIQNTAPRNIISARVLETVPNAKNFPALAALTPAVNIASTGQDVGGTKGETMVWLTVHGSSNQDSKINVDGFETNFGSFTRLFIPNPLNAEETSIDLGGGTAEARVGGVSMNFIPKGGGNVPSADIFGTYTDENLQGSNMSDELAARGLTNATLNRLNELWDVNASLGGPITRDKLWFFGSYRYWGGSNYVAGLFYNKTPNSFVYTPDTGRPALNDFENRTGTVRLTWQATPRNKVSVSYDWQHRCDCHRDITALFSPEAVAMRTYTPVSVLQTKWTYPASNKLLFDGGFAVNWNTLNVAPQPEVGPDAVAILEDTTGFSYNAMFLQQENSYSRFKTLKMQPRFTASYVTGSHAFKAGVDIITDFADTLSYVPNNLKYTFRNGSPTSLQQFAYPSTTLNDLKPDLGIFVQDQWTIRRLTLSMGLRFDYIRISIPSQTLPAVQFRPFPVELAGIDCGACLASWSPRLSAAYDLFGTGKTALKVAIGRYASGRTAVTNNPAGQLVVNANRAWADANRNFVPDCDLLNPALNGECGPISNNRFGQATPGTRLADDVIKGVRTYNWQFSAAVQHEVMRNVSVNVGFFRTDWYNFTATDNTLITPADHDPYCVTLPADPRLPGGGANQLCGLYNITPSLFGRTDNLITLADRFGERTDIYTGVDANLVARFSNGAMVSGGTSTGHQVTDQCFVIDSPQALLFCKVSPPYLTQVKFNGSYPLPWDFQVSGVFQSIPGIPISASHVATNAQVQPTLGRPLSGNAATVTINNIIEPQTMFEGRINQLDLRLTRTFRFGRNRLRGNFDLYNVLNANSILGINTRYGPSWLQPTSVLDARLIKLSAQLSF
jgi:hypothetical protein